MGTSWLRRKCATCDGTVFYLPHWSISPKHCDRCRLAAIHDLRALLQQFLDQEAKLRKQCRTQEDKRLFADREFLRAKVKNTLGEGKCSATRLATLCRADRDLTRLAFRLAKEQRLEDRSPRGSKNIVPKSLAPFLQGGAPGLGKRSS